MFRTSANHYLTFILLMIFSVSSFAGPAYTTYQAKIIKPDGNPLTASGVSFKFTILDDAGLCILYSETYSGINMGSSGGLVSFSLGSGIKTYPASATTFEQVFSNITPFLSCDNGGGTYSPLANDSRKIVMQFDDSNGWQTLPAMSINAVPYAMYASDAQTLGGVSATAYLQKNEIATCSGGQASFYNGTNFVCAAMGGGGVTSSTINTALGFTPADAASFTTLTSSLGNTNSEIFSVSSTVTSLSNTVAASFAAITSSQWSSGGGSEIYYNTGNVGIGSATPGARLTVNGQVSLGKNNSIDLGNISNESSLFGNYNNYDSGGGGSNEAYAFGSHNILDNGGSGSRSMFVFGSQNIATDSSVILGYGVSNTAANSVAIGFNNTTLNILDTGNVGIGTTNPTARVHIVEGSTTVAPLKFTSGSLLAAPAAGAIEYDGSSLYYTDGTNTRRAIAANAGTGTYDNVSTVANSSGNISLYPNSGAGSVVISSTTMSSSPQTGALVVHGGLGVSGTIFTNQIVSNGTIQGSSITATTGLIAPNIYGSVNSGGNLFIDSTVHASKGKVIIAQSGGLVGVGTNNPTELVHVASSGNTGLKIETSASTAAPALKFANTATGDTLFIGMERQSGGSLVASSTGLSMVIGGPSSNDIHFATNGSIKTTINGMSGNFGLGTITPAADIGWASPALEVSGTRGTMVLRTGVSGGISTLRLVGPTTGSDVHMNMIDSSGSLHFGMQSGAVNALVLAKSGNVGVGTTTPNSLLEIAAAGSGTNVLTPSNTTLRITNTDSTSGNYADIRFTGYAGYPAAKISSIFTNQTSTPAGALAFMTTTNSAAGFGERMRIDPAGNIGIGTSTPTEKLEVSGAIKIPGVGQIGPAGVYGYGMYVTGTNNFVGQMYGAASGVQFTNSTGVNTMNIQDNGDVGIGTIAAVSRLTVSANAANANLVTLYNSAPTGVSGFNTYSSSGTLVGGLGWGNYNSGASYNEKLFINSSKAMTFITNNTERMGITSSGLVGIGIEPTNVLSVMHTTPTIGIFDQDMNAADSSSMGKVAFGSAGVEWGSIGLTRRPGFADDVNDMVFKTSFAVGAGGPGVNNEVMRMTAQGYLGIGTSSPAATLDVFGTMRVTGQAYTDTGNGSFTILSDIRYKDVKGSFERGLHEILNIDVIKYNYKKDNPVRADSSKEYVGVSAQNLKQQIPEAVETRKENEKEYLSVNTSPLLFTMINAVKELYAKFVNHDEQIEKQSRRIASLEEQNAVKDKEIKDLKAYLCAKDPSAVICK